LCNCVIPPKRLDLEHRDLNFINITKLTEAKGLFGPKKTAGPDNIKPINCTPTPTTKYPTQPVYLVQSVNHNWTCTKKLGKIKSHIPSQTWQGRLH
jgi:hypothetical protein